MLECSALQVCVVTGFCGDFEAMNQADEPHLKNLPGLDKTPPFSFIVSARKMLQKLQQMMLVIQHISVI